MDYLPSKLLNIDFDNRLKLYHIKNLIDNLMMNPNHYILNKVLNIVDDCKKQIKSDDISKENKDLYTKILDNPEMLEYVNKGKTQPDPSESSGFVFEDNDIDLDNIRLRNTDATMDISNFVLEEDNDEKYKDEKLINLEFPEYKLYADNPKLLSNFEEINVNLSYY